MKTLAEDNTTNPATVPILKCLCTKRNMDSNWQFELFVSNAICAEKAKKEEKVYSLAEILDGETWATRSV